MSGKGIIRDRAREEEYKLLYNLGNLVEEAIDYALSKLAANGLKLSRAEVPRVFLRCMHLLTTGFDYEELDRLDVSYLEFYKFFRKYIEERCWLIVWRLLELRGVKVKEIVITDRMGGEGLSEFRYYMGRDIDCMVVVESPLAKAKVEAARIEEEMNGVLSNELKKIAMDEGTDDYLENSESYDLFEIEVFEDYEDARRWGVIASYDREEYKREIAKVTFPAGG